MFKLRHIVFSAALLAIPAVAQAGCEDYETQAAAQHAMTLGAYGLDTTGNGVACEAYFGTEKRASARRVKKPLAQLTCADFSDQISAQRAYQTGARHLDSNRNGRACDPDEAIFTPLTPAMPSINVACADFTTREQAQTALLAGRVELDRDKNGLACEHLPSQDDLETSEDVDKLGVPSFLWHQNDIGVQPRSSHKIR